LEPDKRSPYLILIDATTRHRVLRIDAIDEVAWSTTGNILYMAGTDGERPRLLTLPARTVIPILTKYHWRLHNVKWIDTDTLMGDASTAVESYLFRWNHPLAARHIVWQVTSDWYPKQARRWFLLRALGSTALLTETYQGRSDGGEIDVYRADLRYRKEWFFHSGQLVAVSPNGERCAVATDDWTGPYKRGGRRCGPLEIISTALPSGQEASDGRQITMPLIAFDGGDWR
jgi:hypothetical protein